jgi:hypothetical protein
VKLNFNEKAKPKIGSKDNIKHVPGGGDVKVKKSLRTAKNSALPNCHFLIFIYHDKTF